MKSTPITIGGALAAPVAAQAVGSVAVPKNQMISVMQTLCMILVVMHHFPLASENIKAINDTFLFRMPVFMFISGFLIKYTLSGNNIYGGGGVFKYIKKKAVRLLVPYVVWVSVVSVFSDVAKNLLFHGFSWDSVKSVLFLTNGISEIYYWFLPVVFSITAVSLLLLCWTRREWILIVPMAISLIMNILDLVSYSGVHAQFVDVAYCWLLNFAYYFLWWGLGFYFCKYQRQVVSALRLDSGWVCLALLGVIFSGFFRPLPDMLLGVVGAMFCVSLGLMYSRRGWSFANPLLGYSFPVYLLSYYMFIICIYVVNMLPVTISVWFLWVFFTAVTVCIPVVVARFVKRRFPSARFLRLVVGV